MSEQLVKALKDAAFDAAEFMRMFLSHQTITSDQCKGVLRQLQKAIADVDADHRDQQAAPYGPYTVEKHGNGFAIYTGRDSSHHGMNWGQLTECNEALAKAIERGLNMLAAAPGAPTEQAEEARPNEKAWQCHGCIGNGLTHATFCTKYDQAEARAAMAAHAKQAEKAQPVPFGHYFEPSDGSAGVFRKSGQAFPPTALGGSMWALYATPPAALAQPLTDAARDVLAERQRQISVEGWTPERDDAEHSLGELAFAASCYVCADDGEAPPAVWPWDWKWWKPKSRRRNLVKAGALILAEIERLDRGTLKGGE